MLRVPRPRVESVRRFVAGRASVGDEAVLRAGPGLLALLEHPLGGGTTPLGAGYHARYNVPLGLTTSAALALLEPVTPPGSWWVGREATVEWLGLPALDATLRAEARLSALSERDALFAIAARSEDGAELLRGQFLLARMTGDGPPGFAGVSGSGLGERARDRRAPSAPAETGLRLRSAPAVLPLGRSAEVVVELGPGGTWDVTADVGTGGGLSVETPAARRLTIEGDATTTAAFTVRADRPDTVNAGRPWTIEIRATSGERAHALTVAIAVRDPDLARGVDQLDARDETTASLLAWTAPEPCAADLARRTLRFSLRLLGRGIRVDAEHPVAVMVAMPETLPPDAVAGMSVIQAGSVLGTGTGAITVTLVDRVAPIELEVMLTARGAAQAEARLAATAAPPLREQHEPLLPDVFRLRPPEATAAEGTYRVPPDVVRLLLNAVAGHAEPLGRRAHPLQGLGVGASLTAGFGLAGEGDPAAPVRSRAAALWIRWLAPPDLDFDLEARGRLLPSADATHTARVEVFDGWGKRTSESELVITTEPGESAAANALLARRHIDRRHTPTPTEPSATDALSRFRARLGGWWPRRRSE